MVAKYLILWKINFFCAFSMLSKFSIISILIFFLSLYICACVCVYIYIYIIQNYFLDLHQEHKQQTTQTNKITRESNFSYVYSALVQLALKEAVIPEKNVFKKSVKGSENTASATWKTCYIF